MYHDLQSSGRGYRKGIFESQDRIRVVLFLGCQRGPCLQSYTTYFWRNKSFSQKDYEAHVELEPWSLWFSAFSSTTEILYLTPVQNWEQSKIIHTTCSSDPRSISVNGFEHSNNNTRQLAVWARNAPDLTICYAGSIGTHLCAKVQPHAPCLLDAACTQAFSHSLAEANVAISLAATGECSSCQCFACGVPSGLPVLVALRHCLS